MKHRVLLVSSLLCFLGALAACGLASGEEFVRIQGDKFTYRGNIVRMKGSNYYPRDGMWAAMWTNWNMDRMRQDAQMMHGLGLNCVRILVPYRNGGWNGANPPADRLQKLEDLVNMLGHNGIRSCVTLFDWETSFPAAGTSTERDHLNHLGAIVGRLKDNKYVFMWDVKNEPDHPANIGGYDNWDYNPVARNKIVSWLERMCNAVRAIDPNHPASAGLRWWENINDVVSFVDIAIFHSYWPNVVQQIRDARTYMGANQRPILCEEFGWPSNPTPCYRDGHTIYDYNETSQLNVYINHLTAFESENIAGCIQWMTFDAKSYTSNMYESFENYFGLWRYDYTLKPAGAYYRDHFITSPFPLAPKPVTQFCTFPGDKRLSLSWKNPSDTDFRGAMIVCRTDRHPTSPSDGALVCDRTAQPGSTDAYTHAGLANGVTYYYSAFAYTTAAEYSPGAGATGVPHATEGITCSFVKTLQDGAPVAMAGKVITGVFAADGCIYVQEPDRTSGIRVACLSSSLVVGDVVNVSGAIGTRRPDGTHVAERQVSNATVIRTGACVPIEPVAMKCLSVGGGPASSQVPGVAGGVGLNNIGLLVKVAGRVTLVVGNYFYVDDGSRIPDISGRIGVMVKCPSTPAVAVGEIVGVAGVVEGSIPVGWTTNRRSIRIREAGDIRHFAR